MSDTSCAGGKKGKNLFNLIVADLTIIIDLFVCPERAQSLNV